MNIEMFHKIRVAALALAACMAGAGLVSADPRSALDALGIDADSARYAPAPSAAGAVSPAGAAVPEAGLSGGRPSKIKDLTVMIYMNGKNNLDKFHYSDLWALSAVSVNKKMDVVIEKGSLGAQDAEGKSFKGSRRYEVRPRGLGGKARAPKVIAEFAKVDMGDWRHALDFVQWAKREYPARRYVFILSDHGSGLFDPKKKEQTKSRSPGTDKGISFDEETGNFISNRQLGQLLKEAGGVDVMVFDACLMQSAEIAYEIKDHAPFVVASEETSWTSTLAYFDVLTQFTYNPALSAEELAKKFVTVSQRLWAGQGVHQSMSVIRTSELGNMISRLDRWARQAEVFNDTAAVKAAKIKVLRFESPWSDDKKQFSPYADLHHFVREYTRVMDMARPGATELFLSATSLLDHIDGPLTAENATFGKDSTGLPMYNARGISIYVPPARWPVQDGAGNIAFIDAAPEHQARMEAAFGNKYEEFSFAGASGWRGFVNYLWSVR